MRRKEPGRECTPGQKGVGDFQEVRKSWLFRVNTAVREGAPKRF